MLRLGRVRDFYLVNAIRKDLTDDTTISSPRAQQKLLEDSEIFFDHLSTHLARAFYDYLLLACAGEARHAGDKIAKRYFIDDVLGGERDVVFARAVNFDPVSLQQACVKVFDQKWSGHSFGGEKWLEIAKAIPYYLTWPASVFVDYCVDLQHNNGTAFSKPEISSVADFSIDSHHFTWFLDWKRDTNILKDGSFDYDGPKLHVSFYAYRLYRRWYTIRRREPVQNWVITWGVKTTYNPVKWGTEKAEVVRKYEDHAEIIRENGKIINGKSVSYCHEEAFSTMNDLISEHKTNWATLSLKDARTHIQEAKVEIAEEMPGIIDEAFTKCYLNGIALKGAKTKSLNQLLQYAEETLDKYLCAMIDDRKSMSKVKTMLRPEVLKILNIEEVRQVAGFGGSKLWKVIYEHTYYSPTITSHSLIGLLEKGKVLLADQKKKEEAKKKLEEEAKKTMKSPPKKPSSKPKKKEVMPENAGLTTPEEYVQKIESLLKDAQEVQRDY